MKPEIVDYTKERLKIIEEEIKKCKDEQRKSALRVVKENILKFWSDKKVELNVA